MHQEQFTVRSVRDTRLSDDYFQKCYRFLESPSVRRHDRTYAAELFGGVSPPDNAGPWMETDRQPILQFSTNDYLGLSRHPEVRRAAAEIVAQYGIGSPMGSRLMTGNTELHEELERALAKFKRTEAAIIFPAGLMAMLGSLVALSGPDDLLLVDEHAHASLMLGARASKADLRVFRHNDLNHLESLLERWGRNRPTAIIVDGVYSMQGDLGPLDALVELKERYGARLIVDDAHGTGVFGEHGRGTAAHFGVEDRIDLHMGTFSKAVGTVGGFAAGSAEVIQFLRYHAPTYIFTKSMPLAVVAATLRSLELLQQADDRREQLHQNAREVQERLRERGFDLGYTQSPITPVSARGFDAINMAYELRTACRIWVSPAVFPAVPMDRPIIRIIPTAMHSQSDIESLVDGLTNVRLVQVLGATQPV